MRLTDLQKHYIALRAAVDAEYWRFTRCANVNPTRMAELSAEAERARRACSAQERMERL